MYAAAIFGALALCVLGFTAGVAWLVWRQAVEAAGVGEAPIAGTQARLLSEGTVGHHCGHCAGFFARPMGECIIRCPHCLVSHSLPEFDAP